MKKCFFLFLLLCVSLTIVKVSADQLVSTSIDDIPAEQAITIAEEAFSKATGWVDYPRNNLVWSVPSLVLFDESSAAYRAWVVTFHWSEGSLVYFATINAETAEIIEEGPDEIIPSWQNPLYISWVERKGPMHLWSHEDKVTFECVYKGIPRERANYGIPGENDLPAEEALRIATKAIQEKYALSEAEIAQYVVDYEFFVRRMFGDMEHNEHQWNIGFLEEAQDESGSFMVMYNVGISAVDGTVHLVYSRERDG